MKSTPLVPAVSLLMLVVIGASAVAQDDLYDCESSGVTLFKTEQVRVYGERGRGDQAQAVGCYRASGDGPILTDRYMDGRLVFHDPPAFAAFGSFVGYGVRDEREGRTVVEVRDVAAGWEAPVLRRLAAAKRPHKRIGIAEVKIGRDQALAWTTCPLGEIGDSYMVHFHEGCESAWWGAFVRVFRARAGSTTKELLDRGRRIPPRSLRRKGDRIYWKNAGRVRSARL